MQATAPRAAAPPRPSGESPIPDVSGSRRRLIVLGVGIVFVALLVLSFPGLGDIRERFGHARPVWLVLSGLCELTSVLSFVVVFRPTFCRLLPWGLSYRIAVAEQGTNVLVPTGGAGGLAVGAWVLRRTGMSTDRIARRSVAFFVITSGANFATAIVFGWLLAAGILPTSATFLECALPALAAMVVIGTVAALPMLLHRVPDWTDHEDSRVKRIVARAGGSLANGIEDAGELLRSGRPAVILGSLGYMAFDIAALFCAFHALGAAPQGTAFVLAYVLGQLGGLIPLPGGVGGTDGGLVGALALYGTPVAAAAAAVLAYRVFQLCLPAILGVIAFTGLRKDDAVPVVDGC